MRIHIDDYTPHPCKRPRVGKNGNVYSPTASHERSLALLMRGKADRVQQFGDDQLAVAMVVCYKGAVKGDADNLAKTVLDAGQKAGFYKNDRQVVDLHVVLCDYQERDSTTIEMRSLC